MQSRADALVMTEKDAVKWPAVAEAELPTYALRIEMTVEGEADFMDTVLARLPLPRRGGLSV